MPKMLVSHPADACIFILFRFWRSRWLLFMCCGYGWCYTCCFCSSSVSLSVFSAAVSWMTNTLCTKVEVLMCCYTSSAFFKSCKFVTAAAALCFFGFLCFSVCASVWNVVLWSLCMQHHFVCLCGEGEDVNVWDKKKTDEQQLTCVTETQSSSWVKVVDRQRVESKKGRGSYRKDGACRLGRVTPSCALFSSSSLLLFYSSVSDSVPSCFSYFYFHRSHSMSCSLLPTHSPFSSLISLLRGDR